MPNAHDIDALEIALHDLARSATGRLVAVTVGVPSTISETALVAALSERLATGDLVGLRISTRTRGDVLRILSAEFTRSQP